LPNSEHIQVGVRVLILRPCYVAGKYGVVCGQESKLDSQAKQRWLIEVENADSSVIIVSLILGEFTLVNPE
jgi:hypothetical protein